MKLRILIAAAALAVSALAIAADDEEAKGLPDGAGKETVVKLCLSCHGTGNFRKRRLAREGWVEQVADMVDRGAQATDAQSAEIVDYLAKNYGPGAKVLVNTAPFEELKAQLGLTIDEIKAVMAWRKEKGPFRSVEELESVPGIDAKKIESEKQIIQF